MNNKEKYLKRLGYFLLVFLLISFLIWDFSGSDTQAEGRKTIRYWFITGAKEEVPYHARKFNKLQDSIIVRSTAIPWNEHEKKILTGILSGSPPDIIQQVTPVPKWASRMALVPLDEFIRRDGFDTTVFFDALWEEMKWRGSVYALPVNSVSYAFLYNKRLFREAGLDPDAPPATWAELSEMNSSLLRRDNRGRIVQMGFIPNYGNLQTSILMSWQLGAEFLTDDGARISMNNDAATKAFTWLADFYKEYPIQDVNAYMAGFGYAEQHGFLSEKVAMMILDSSFLDQIERYRPDLEFGVTLVPSFPGTTTVSSSGSWWLAIPRGARNPNAAWELMKLAVTTETQIENIFEMEENLFPANRAAAYDTLFMKDDITEIFVNQMDYSRSPSIIPIAHDVFWREFMGAQERVIHALQTPEVALTQAERIVQRALDDALEYDRYVRAHMDKPAIGK
jgi:multiple sugar transport system substrate-binding protein